MYIYIFDTGFWSYFFNELTFMQQIQMVTDNYLLWFAFLIILGVPGWALGWLLVLAFKKKPDITHGSARWGTLADAIKHKLAFNDYNGPATMIGKMSGKLIGLLYHVIIIAKTRFGKGVGYVIPLCIRYKGSIVCNDVKGENYGRTSRHRREMGQNVYKFDPYDLMHDEYGQSCFNPLDYVKDGDPDSIATARQISRIIASPHDSGDAFFTQYGEKIVTLYILYVCAKCEQNERNLGTVRYLLSRIGEEQQAILNEMKEMEQEFFGIIQTDSCKMMELRGDPTKPANNTILGLLATADIMTSWLDDPRIKKALSKSDFQPEMFRYEPSSLYIIVEPNKISICTLLIKIIYSLVIEKNNTKRDPLQAKEMGLKKMKLPLKMVMDEFAQLGKFEPIKEALPVCASNNLWFIIIVQNIGQLDEFYNHGKMEFLTNCCKVFLGSEDEDTSAKISTLCGKTTVMQESYSVKSGLIFNQRQSTFTPTARELITPGEAGMLGEETSLLWKGGVPPLKTDKIYYYLDDDFKGLYDEFDG